MTDQTAIIGIDLAAGFDRGSVYYVERVEDGQLVYTGLAEMIAAAEQMLGVAERTAAALPHGHAGVARDRRGLRAILGLLRHLEDPEHG